MTGAWVAGAPILAAGFDGSALLIWRLIIRLSAACPGRLGSGTNEDQGGEITRMLFMVIERFADNDMVPVYQRLRDQGRGLPEGREYLDSWVEPNFARCFQLMRCEDPRRFLEWVLHWRGCGVSFEIVPIVPSMDTREIVAPYLDNTQDQP